VGLRYRKTIGIGGGARINLSKSGVGISVGVKGLRVGTGPRGARITASIPGTGLSYTKQFGPSDVSASSTTECSCCAETVDAAAMVCSCHGQDLEPGRVPSRICPFCGTSISGTSANCPKCLGCLLMPVCSGSGHDVSLGPSPPPSPALAAGVGRAIGVGIGLLLLAAWGGCMCSSSINSAGPRVAPGHYDVGDYSDAPLTGASGGP
jgi:hypothetical protein